MPYDQEHIQHRKTIQLHLPTCSTAWDEVERWEWGCPARATFPSAAHTHRSQAHRKEQQVPTSASPALLHECRSNVCMNRWWSKEDQKESGSPGTRWARRQLACAMEQQLHSATFTAHRFTHKTSCWIPTVDHRNTHQAKMPGDQEVTRLQDSGEQLHCPPTAGFTQLARPLHYWSSFGSDFPRSYGNELVYLREKASSTSYCLVWEFCSILRMM